MTINTPTSAPRELTLEELEIVSGGMQDEEEECSAGEALNDAGECEEITDEAGASGSDGRSGTLFPPSGFPAGPLNDLGNMLGSSPTGTPIEPIGTPTMNSSKDSSSSIRSIIFFDRNSGQFTSEAQFDVEGNEVFGP